MTAPLIATLVVDMYISSQKYFSCQDITYHLLKIILTTLQSYMWWSIYTATILLLPFNLSFYNKTSIPSTWHSVREYINIYTCISKCKIVFLFIIHFNLIEQFHLGICRFTITYMYCVDIQGRWPKATVHKFFLN